MFFGLILIVIGAILLLKQLGIIHQGSFWGYLWPILLLALGLKMLIGRDKER